MTTVATEQHGDGLSTSVSHNAMLSAVRHLMQVVSRPCSIQKCASNVHARGARRSVVEMVPLLWRPANFQLAAPRCAPISKHRRLCIFVEHPRTQHEAWGSLSTSFASRGALERIYYHELVPYPSRNHQNKALRYEKRTRCPASLWSRPLQYTTRRRFGHPCRPSISGLDSHGFVSTYRYPHGRTAGHGLPSRRPEAAHPGRGYLPSLPSPRSAGRRPKCAVAWKREHSA